MASSERIRLFTVSNLGSASGKISQFQLLNFSFDDHNFCESQREVRCIGLQPQMDTHKPFRYFATLACDTEPVLSEHHWASNGGFSQIWLHSDLVNAHINQSKSVSGHRDEDICSPISLIASE